MLHKCTNFITHAVPGRETLAPAAFCEARLSLGQPQLPVCPIPLPSVRFIRASADSGGIRRRIAAGKSPIAPGPRITHLLVILCPPLGPCEKAALNDDNEDFKTQLPGCREGRLNWKAANYPLIIIYNECLGVSPAVCWSVNKSRKNGVCLCVCVNVQVNTC